MPASFQLRRFTRPIQAILLAFPIALFFSALVSDITYLNTAEIQWSNLSQWAITGALLFGAPVIVFAVLDFLRNRRSAREKGAAIFLGLVTAMWLLGLINAFKHSQDAWSSVGVMGVILSLICSVAAFVAGWIAYSAPIIAGETA